MRKALLYTFGGLAIYLVSLVAMLPAEPVLEWGAPRLQAQGVNLAATGVEGTLWSGQAASLSVNGIPLGHANWDLAPLQMLIGRLGAHWMVQPQDGYLSGDLTAGSEELNLTGLDGRLPAAQIMSYAPALPVQIEGEISTRMEQVAISPAGLREAKGTLVWHGAALTAPMAMPLGDLRVELSTAADGNIVGDVGDAGGPLDISGQIVLSPQGTYRLELNLATRAGASKELEQALGMLGRAGPGGKHRFTYSGRLPI
jgi:general secretion pathway protein N